LKNKFQDSIGLIKDGVSGEHTLWNLLTFKIEILIVQKHRIDGLYNILEFIDSKLQKELNDNDKIF